MATFSLVRTELEQGNNSPTVLNDSTEPIRASRKPSKQTTNIEREQASHPSPPKWRGSLPCPRITGGKSALFKK